MLAANFHRSYATPEGYRDSFEYSTIHDSQEPLLSADMTFAAAFDAWMKRHTLRSPGDAPTDARYLARSTDSDYWNCIQALGRWPAFREIPLRAITPELLMEYQAARSSNAETEAGGWWCRRGARAQGPFETRELAAAWAAERGNRHELRQTLWSLPAGANRIRKEVQMAVRLLRDARLWGGAEDRRMLRLQAVDPEMPRAMTLQEQHRFLCVAAARLEYRLVYQYAIVALQTTAATNEMRALRLCDVMLESRIIQIPPRGAKNKYRMRAIPIVTEDAAWALEGLLARAHALGASMPTHYLFPKHVTQDRYDPREPMSESGLAKPWNVVRTAAGLPALRLYDLRHTGITRMAEAGVPLAVTMTFAGHMTRQMQQRYTAICMAAQRGWGEQVWGEMRGAAMVPEVARTWPMRKPVRAESMQGYQKNQHLHSYRALRT